MHNKKVKSNPCSKTAKKCETKFCRRAAAKGRFCHRCEHANRKANNPYAYWLGVNRRNARRRGKNWEISLEYWVQWCDETGYLALKGRYKNDLSIDCKINELGYVDGNLKPLTVSDNAKKGVKRVVWNYVTRQWDVIPPPPLVPNYTTDDLPF